MAVPEAGRRFFSRICFLMISYAIMERTCGNYISTGNDVTSLPCAPNNHLRGFLTLLAEFALFDVLGKLDGDTVHSLRSLNVSDLKRVAFHEQSLQDLSKEFDSKVTAASIQTSTDLQKLKKWLNCKDLGDLKPSFEREPQTWQPVESRKVLVFSAFYESREEADGPAIRIIASGYQAAYNDIGILYCQLWYKESDTPVVSLALYKVIYPSTAHHDSWCSHFIICRIPPLVVSIPVAVSVVPSPCVQSHNNLMVLNRKLVKKRGHGVCISPLYGKWRNWTMIAEWFEIHRLLGADGITIYNLSVSRDTDYLLRHYISRKSADVINWDFPPVKTNVYCQRGALNDCLYRMGHRYHYVAVTDLDEILVPRVVSTWPALMSRIGRPAIGVYMFQHLYFRRNHTDPKEIPLVTQTSFWRTEEVTPPGKIRCKSMYRAERAISIDLHYHYTLVRGSEEYMLPPEEGVLHHYRNKPMQSFVNPKDPVKRAYVEDRHMEKFKEKLKQAVTPRIETTRRDIESDHSP